jgi:hypothetical protein
MKRKPEYVSACLFPFKSCHMYDGDMLGHAKKARY